MTEFSIYLQKSYEMSLIKKNCLPPAVLFFVTLFCALPVLAEGYSSGHQALEVWDGQAQASLPLWIKVWLLFMVSVYAAGLLFIKNHIEARWLVGGFVLGLLFSKYAIPALGLVNLSGLVALVHLVFWSPALYLMLKNRPFTQGVSFYSGWAGVATLCILFSFVFDIRDAFLYLRYIY